MQLENNKIMALFDSSSEINTMTVTYAAKLGLTLQKTIVNAHKIDGLTLKTYKIVTTKVLIQHKLNRDQLIK